MFLCLGGGTIQHMQLWRFCPMFWCSHETTQQPISLICKEIRRSACLRNSCCNHLKGEVSLKRDWIKSWQFLFIKTCDSESDTKRMCQILVQSFKRKKKKKRKKLLLCNYWFSLIFQFPARHLCTAQVDGKVCVVEVFFSFKGGTTPAFGGQMGLHCGGCFKASQASLHWGRLQRVACLLSANLRRWILSCRTHSSTVTVP